MNRYLRAPGAVLKSSVVRFRRLTLLAFSIGAASVAAHENIPASPQVGPVVIVGATVHTALGESLKNGRVRFEAGRIVAVGADEVSTDGAEVIDAAGLDLYPGFIAANTSMGLSEVAAVRATNDNAEVGANNADVRAEVAVNPDSEMIPVTRANGVLLAQSVPSSGNGNVIAGRSAVLRLDGWTIDDMRINSAGALHVNWPGGAIPEWLPGPARAAALEAQKKSQKALRQAFEDARRYAAARRDAATIDIDRRLEAMRDAMEGRQPVFFNANDAASIEASLAFAREFRLKPVIVGGADAAQVADQLRADGAAVILTGLHRLPAQRDDAVDSLYTLPAQLLAARVPFAIGAAADGFSLAFVRNLSYEAAAAVGFGLSEQEALRSVTLYPARILGIDDRYGSIADGRSATIFLSDGDALEPSSHVVRAWIEGREIDLRSRHTRLYDKYRQKYPETRD